MGELRKLSNPVKMEQLLVLLLVSSSLGLNYNTNNCADISTYSDVAYNMSISQVCHYTTERRCEPRSKRLCINTPLTQCHIQTFTNCRSIPTIDTYRHDKTKTETFVPKKCQQSGVRIFEEVKNEAVCKTEVKRVCDRVFDTDSVTGRQIEVSGGENCQDKEYENCELQPVVIKTEVPQYECFDDTPITYVLPVFMEFPVTTHQTKCEPKAVSVCVTTQKNSCQVVEWEECHETVHPQCNDLLVAQPQQEYDHRKKCIGQADSASDSGNDE